MTIRINNGNKFSSGKTQEEKDTLDRQKQWGVLRTKLDVILRNNKIFKPDDMQKLCQSLDSMDEQERSEFIKTNWGQLYLDKAMPILKQLSIIEGFA